MTASVCWHRPIFPGRRQPSIVGTGELNYRVRDGNGWTLTAIDTNCLYIYSDFSAHTLYLVTRTRFELVLPA